MSIFTWHPCLDAVLNQSRPGPWQQFLDNPCIFLARKLYTWQPIIPAQPVANPVSIVCISDTHNHQPALPDSDILIHAGDLTETGSFHELQSTLNWLQAQPHSTKIVIAGNHDQLLDPNCDARSSSRRSSSSFSQKQQTAAAAAAAAAAERAKLDWGDIIYLENAATTIACANGRRLRVYGSPSSARHGTPAFQFPREEDVWSTTVPDDVDVLITHSPPRAHLDALKYGCVHLRGHLWRTRPRLHVFGHIHEGAGTEWLRFDALQCAYEGTVVSGGRLWNLMCTVKEFVRAFFRPPSEARSLLVNASILGGLPDGECRRPIRVVI